MEIRFVRFVRFVGFSKIDSQINELKRRIIHFKNWFELKFQIYFSFNSYSTRHRLQIEKLFVITLQYLCLKMYWKVRKTKLVSKAMNVCRDSVTVYCLRVGFSFVWNFSFAIKPWDMNRRHTIIIPKNKLKKRKWISFSCLWSENTDKIDPYIVSKHFINQMVLNKISNDSNSKRKSEGF